MVAGRADRPKRIARLNSLRQGIYESTYNAKFQAQSSAISPSEACLPHRLR
jgi:hypothetical protein